MLILGCETGFSQGTFANLDFENPITPLVPVNFQVPTTNGIPGWAAYTYGGSSSFIVYNTLSLGAAAVSLQGPGSHELIIQGNYTVYLQGSSAGSPGSAAVGQVGQIPVGSKSLLFWGSLFMNVSFNGQTMPLSVVGQTLNYLIVGADVSEFAGQTGELLFTAPAGFSAFLDNVQFSTSPIPEPESVALVPIGILAISGAFMRRRWRRIGRARSPLRAAPCARISGGRPAASERRLQAASPVGRVPRPGVCTHNPSYRSTEAPKYQSTEYPLSVSHVLCGKNPDFSSFLLALAKCHVFSIGVHQRNPRSNPLS